MLLTTLCFLAQAAPVPYQALPLRVRSEADGLPGVALEAAPELLANLEGVRELRLTIPDPRGGSDLLVELVPVPVARGGALYVDGEPAGQVGDGVELSLWGSRGDQGAAGSAFFAFSPHGNRGWVRAGDRTVHLLAERDFAGGWSRARLVDQRDLPAPEPFACATAALPQPRPSASSPAGSHQGAAPAQSALLAQELFRCRMAVETDHQYYQLFGSAAAAEAYTLSLVGAVSHTYRSEVGVVVELPYLGLHTTANDPWVSQDVGGGAGDLLGEFRNAWGNGAPVPGDLNHFFSGAGLGGGVAWLDVLCSPYFGFAVSGNLGGNTPFPVLQNPLNWDFFVVAHELGHNFSSPHTHDYCPPLDQCAPAGFFGGCQTVAACQPGTIMSYCHLCEGGIGNIAPSFHPVVRQRMRTAVEASCLLPYSELEVANLGQGSGSGPQPLVLAAQWNEANRTLAFPYFGAPAPTAGLLVVGANQATVPLGLGVLVPTPDLLLSASSPATAGSFGPFPIGNGFPLGVELYAQAWLVNFAVPGFLTASNALQLNLIAPALPSPILWVASPFANLEYALTPPGTWFQAEKFAASHGAVLAALDSVLLEAWLRSVFFDSGLSGGSMHIGYTDRYSEGSFQWVSGATGGYTNWAPGEPNNWGNGEDFAQWPWNGTQWNDASGYETLRGLIQRPR